MNSKVNQKHNIVHSNLYFVFVYVYVFLITKPTKINMCHYNKAICHKRPLTKQNSLKRIVQPQILIHAIPNMCDILFSKKK